MYTQKFRANSCALVQPIQPKLQLVTHVPAGRYEIAPRITQIDRAIIRGALHQQASSTLKPGLRVQRMAGQRLPRGVCVSPLPAKLERKLSALPTDFERVLVDCDVLLMQSATREIVDVMRNACAPDALEANAARGRVRFATAGGLPGSARNESSAQWRLYERIAIW